MPLKLPAALLLTLLLLFLLSRPAQASDVSDLQLILASAKPGQPFVKAAYLKPSRTEGTDVLYEGRQGDIEILAWVSGGVTDSLFLTVRGRHCPDWSQVLFTAFTPAETCAGNFRGGMLRHVDSDLEYYLVLVNKHADKNLLTDLTIFRRGPGHETNERYHEFADIWQDILTSPAEEFKWPDPSVKE